MLKTFECKVCGECCHGKGGIRVDHDEITAISRFLRLSPQSFVREYCEHPDEKPCASAVRPAPMPSGKVSIRTGKDGFCIFFHKDLKCLIHTVKPKICALWPFFPALLNDRDAWEMAKTACPGLNPDCSHKDFIREARESFRECSQSTP